MPVTPRTSQEDRPEETADSATTTRFIARPPTKKSLSERVRCRANRPTSTGASSVAAKAAKASGCASSAHGFMAAESSAAAGPASLGPSYNRTARPPSAGRRSRPFESMPPAATGKRSVAVLAAILLGACVPAPRDKVVVLGFDGLDPVALETLMGEGRLPHFAKAAREGTFTRLRSMMPMWSPVIWTTIATGRRPDEHGIIEFSVFDTERGKRVPSMSLMRRVRALWNIASDAGRTVDVVGWWATWPAERVNGAIVSDHFNYHFTFRQGLEGEDSTQGKTYPPELLDELAPLVVTPDDIGYEQARPFIDVPREEFDRPFDFDFDDRVAHFRWALAAARTNERIGLHLLRRDRADLTMVYIEGTDTVGHLFGHLFKAPELGGPLAEQQRHFGHAVERMYEYADEILGRFLDEIDDRTTLVVLSDHGFRLGELPADPRAALTMGRTGANIHRKEGVLILYGNRVRAGAVPQERPTVFDVAPTVLALLGLPASREMPGRVLTDLVELDPPPRIATYETEPLESAPLQADAAVDERIMQRLESLGYVGGELKPSPRKARVTAAVLYEIGRKKEALEAYQRLAAENPDDPDILVALGGLLGEMGRWDEAEEHLERARRLDPIHPGALHNLAVLAERRGDLRRALELYGEVMRYYPDYEPTRTALERLLGPEGMQEAAQAGEDRRLWDLLNEAQLLARRGLFDEALDRLDRAQALAPDEPAVYQYRANVFVLTGQRDRAVAELRKGLELEPDNALFRENLRRLGVELPVPGRR
ncbi:MAG: hypothetical protein D6718_03500 [Acidobacteria bacterium]|nr:MAG: hypothetical protein D6718_03500 [Acidobacteriota bacterium]